MTAKHPLQTQVEDPDVPYDGILNVRSETKNKKLKYHGRNIELKHRYRNIETGHPHKYTAGNIGTGHQVKKNQIQ